MLRDNNVYIAFFNDGSYSMVFKNTIAEMMEYLSSYYDIENLTSIKVYKNGENPDRKAV